MLSKFLSLFFAIVTKHCLPTYIRMILVIYTQLVSRLKEFDQQPSINISFLPVPNLITMNNFFGQNLEGECFGKPLWFLCPCYQTIEMDE